MSSHHEQIEKFAKKLEEWDYKIDRMEHRVMDLPDELRSIAQNKYQKLLDYRSGLKEKEDKLVASSEHAVHEIEKSVEDVWNTVSLLFKEVEMEVEVEGT
jgi:uncharacterized coiled-coil DUF342 family protein